MMLKTPYLILVFQMTWLLAKLSTRECEIIVMLEREASNKEIARTLGLAESTVKSHAQGILRKLNLASRVQAAVYAVEHDLVNKK